MPQRSFRQEKVLVLMRSPEEARSLLGVLSGAGLTPVVCCDLVDCCEQLDEQTSALLVEEELIGPDHVFHLATALEKQPAWSDLPILILTNRHESAYAPTLFDSLNGTAISIQRPLLPENLIRTLKLAIRDRQRQFQIRDMLRDLETAATNITERLRAEEALRNSEHRLRLGLAQTNSNLEKLVKQRTAQLQEANEQLMSEIEQRKRTESYLRASEHRYRDLVQVSPDAICICRNNRIIFVNKAAEQLFGAVSSLQLLDRTVNELFQANQLTRGNLFIQKMIRLENPSLSTFETQIVRLDGEVRDVDVAWSPFREGSETSIQLLLHDATERKLIERQILKAVDKERELLGRELHDGLCQLLTAAKFKVGLIERKLVRNKSADPSDARALEFEINRAIEQAREMARGLNPVSLVARGLGSALNELAANVEKSFQIRCGCNLCEEVTIADQTTAHHLYRIAQEAVNNAVRHAKPKCIQVNLQTDGNAIALEILDDGAGFHSPLNSTGMGLRNMRARAELIGALIHIDSNSGGGTIVRCRLQQMGKTFSPDSLAS